MQRPIPAKNSRSFLEKFQGKKNAISREGLLHLLDMKKQSFDDLPQPKQKQKVILLREPKPQSPINLKEIRVERAKNSGKDSALSNPTGVLNDFHERYAKMRQELKEPKSVEITNSSKLRLPAINKSSSHSTQIHKKNTETAPSQQTEVNTGQRMRSLPRKMESGQSLILNNITKKIQLDKYALRHLEFLDKFQKQLLHGQTNAKKTSRSEYH